jgi:hypothetical protein
MNEKKTKKGKSWSGKQNARRSETITRHMQSGNIQERVRERESMGQR